MKEFLSKFPDMAVFVVFAAFGRLGAFLSGEPIPEFSWLYLMLFLIWMRLAKIDLWPERKRTRSS